MFNDQRKWSFSTYKQLAIDSLDKTTLRNIVYASISLQKSIAQCTQKQQQLVEYKTLNSKYKYNIPFRTQK